MIREGRLDAAAVNVLALRGTISVASGLGILSRRYINIYMVFYIYRTTK